MIDFDDTPETLPCPFCGELPLIIQRPMGTSISCKECNIRFTEDGTYQASLEGMKPDFPLIKLINKWNTRSV